MSLYSIKKTTAVQPWSETVAFGGRIRDFYDSRGDAVISSPTEIATVLDGPEKVVRYGNLTVSSTLTASQRCKGLTIICDSLTINSVGNITMTARGCRVDRNNDPRYPFVDFLVPNKIALYSEVMSRKAALELISRHGFTPWDRGLWDADTGAAGLGCSIVEAGLMTLLSAAGCGSGGASKSYYNTNGPGNAGAAGSSGGLGGGGSGGVWGSSHSLSWRGGFGCPYSGGSGSGGIGNDQGNPATGVPGSMFSGPGGSGGVTVSWNPNYQPFAGESVPLLAGYGGGGTGNPGGKQAVTASSGQADGNAGTGGKLVIICYGNITIGSGGKIEANGVAGGNGSSVVNTGFGGGGGSGGGHVSLIYGGTLSNSGTIQAAGGSGGIGAGNGGAGGAGSVVTKTFAQMGWS